jgi:hypothetical protein
LTVWFTNALFRGKAESCHDQNADYCQGT